MLTENELQIIELLWKHDRPLSRSEIISLSPSDKTWKDCSIHILLNSLLKKEAIREAGFVRSGKVFSRTFEHVLSGEDYYARKLAAAAKKTNISSFFAALLDDSDIDTKTISELEHLIEKKKTELR